MRWLESIRLRTVQAPAERIVADFRAHLEGLGDEAGLVGANLYGGLMPQGDFSLILFWSTDQAQPCGSLTARLLLPLLREHGLVSHTVWVENSRIDFVDGSRIDFVDGSRIDFVDGSRIDFVDGSRFDFSGPARAGRKNNNRNGKWK